MASTHTDDSALIVVNSADLSSIDISRLCLSLCFELLIFHIGPNYLGSYRLSLFLGFYVSFYFFLAAHKWFVNPVLAIRPVCSLFVFLCHCLYFYAIAG